MTGNNHQNEDVDLVRRIVDMSPAGMMAIDQSGRIVLINREIERLLQYSKDELLGEPVERLVPDRFRDQHPHHRSLYFTEPQARPMGTGRDLYARRKDGQEVPVEIGLNPVRYHGEMLVLASVVDISARKRADDRFAAAVESSPSGMLMTDAQGRILLVNQEVERLFGYQRGELIGQSVDMLVPKRLRSIHPKKREGFFRDPRTRPMGVGRDLYGVRKDGTEILIEIGLNPIRTEEGDCVLCSVVDITSRRETEDRLRQTQKMEAIGTLAGGIAHDFNNILLGITGYTELVRAGDNLLPQQRQDLEQILLAAERGRQLVQRILTFSKQRDIVRMPIDPKVTVHEILQLLRASLPRNIEIDEQISDRTPMLLSDETQLQQIVMNLATNGAQAMPNGGALVVKLDSCAIDQSSELAQHVRPGHYIRLQVEDSGAGMSEEVRLRALEPFFTTNSTGRGTGLGLAVVHGVVEAHHGMLDLRSQPGEGTCVSVYLPALQASIDDEAQLLPTSIDQKRVLLVDDEVSIAAMLKRQITALGYQVVMHTSSISALEAFQREPMAYDLLVTDNSMPKMTGMELAQRVLHARPALPVLLISGLADVADRGELHAAGITSVLAKPHTMDQLRETIHRILDPKAPKQL
jgi:PAS domain S-box-containing protein